MTDFLQISDSEFRSFLRNLITQIGATPGDYGMTSQDVDDLRAVQVNYESDLDAHVTAQDAAQAATAKKDNSRGAAENVVRKKARRIEANDTVTDEAKKRAKLPVHKTGRTPVPVPATKPIFEFDINYRLAVKVAFMDEVTLNSGARRAKPEGVHECEIRYAAGDAAPGEPEEMAVAGHPTRSPLRVKFKAADAGRKAWFCGRWVNTRGQPGPFNQLQSVTIPA